MDRRAAVGHIADVLETQHSSRLEGNNKAGMRVLFMSCKYCICQA